MSKSNSLAASMVRLPVLWGGIASLGFYAIIHQGWLQHELVDRYFASHPIEYLTITLFFVGIAALVIKGFDLAAQFGALGRLTLGPVPADGQAVGEASRLLTELEHTTKATGLGYLPQRLRSALEYVQRKGAADTLDEHLRFSSDLDIDKMQASYSLVRIIIWAIPILGFLGTVVGITLAIAKLGHQDMGNLEQSLPAVISGLEVAFDTTALALALSIVLMFAQFVADRWETRLLAKVDQRVAEELVGRFQEYGAATDPHAATLKRMAETVLGACETLVQRQAELWQNSIAQLQTSWTRTTTETGDQLEAAFTRSLETVLQQHADEMGQLQRENTEQQRTQFEMHTRRLADDEQATRATVQALWAEAVEALRQNAEAVSGQQHELTRQGDILLKVVDATGQVKELESSLNDNLRALAGANNFEETVMSLAAAIGLLNKQLHTQPTESPRVDLNQAASANHAA